MTHLSKTALALLLLAGGFVAARTFGPPDLAQRFVNSLRPEPASQWGELRPAEPADHRAEYLAPLDAVEMPASFSSAYTKPPASTQAPAAAASPTARPQATPPPLPQPTAVVNNWPTMPALADTKPRNDSWPPVAAGVTPLAYESHMVPLRAAPAPGSAPQPYEAAKPAADPWLNVPANLQSPVGEQQPPAPAAQEFDPWGTQPSVAPPSQFIGYPAEASHHPLDAPVTAPAMWRAEPTTALSPLEPFTDDDEEEAAAARTHIVTDGDSLQRLAKRYLGDESRSGDIFEHNRDVLTHPDLLPLGVELQLP